MHLFFSVSGAPGMPGAPQAPPQYSEAPPPYTQVVYKQSAQTFKCILLQNKQGRCVVYCQIYNSWSLDG